MSLTFVMPGLSPDQVRARLRDPWIAGQARNDNQPEH